MRQELVTIERFILDQQPADATGTLTALLYDLALCGKLIASRTRRAGLTDLLGHAGTTNVQDEEQKVLDVYADEVVHELLSRSGRVSALVSEERAEHQTVGDGPYVVVYDPLDGSSNIESDVSIGTIFGVFRSDEELRGTREDCLRPGRDLVAAGYILYSTATLLVYSAGDGTHVFTLDPEVGEFLLTEADLRYPDDPTYYSINYAAAGRWPEAVERYVTWLDSDEPPLLSQRYIGSAVADFHRNLIHGGVFGYPSDDTQPEGKLRLLYEAAPLAFLADQAGGYATDGHTDLLDVVPTELHQRTPVFVGDTALARKVESFVSGTR